MTGILLSINNGKSAEDRTVDADSTVTLSAQIIGHDGNVTAPDSLRFKIYCKTCQTEVIGETFVNNPKGLNSIVLTSQLNRLIDPSHGYAKRRIEVTAFWPDLSKVKTQFDYYIVNT